MTQIAPSILAADFLNLGKDVETVNKYADLFHLDVMDGRLVPNISFGFPIVEAIAKKAEVPMDVHLMITHPECYIERFAKTGAKMISFHLEAARDPEPVLGLVKEQGCLAGLAINPDMPVSKLFPYLYECDFVLIMSVFAGFGGQKFIETTYDRIKELKAEIDARGLSTKIEVDGGVSPANAGKLVECGAEILVAGSAVFKAENPAEIIAQMR